MLSVALLVVAFSWVGLVCFAAGALWVLERQQEQTITRLPPGFGRPEFGAIARRLRMPEVSR